MPDDLADRIERHVLRLVGVAVGARDRVGGDHELQRHAERLGRSGFSQASVQSLRSMRQGLPGPGARAHGVLAGRAQRGSCCAGGASASSTVSQSEPVHTPCAPIASAAAICRPSPMPPAASTGSGATASITWGQSTTLPTSPVCPPPSLPCAITKSTPAALCASACLTLPHSAATSRPEAWMSLDHVGGRRAERVGDDACTFGCLRIISTCGPAVVAVQPSSSRAFSPSGSSGTPCSASSFCAKSRCSAGISARSFCLELRRRRGLALALVLAGDHDVDAVGLVADVLVDPLELDLELLGA